jgi:RNA polymerase sigma-70 factor (ECF subfamily)
LDEDTEIYDETVLEDQAIGNVNYDLLVDFIRSMPQGMRDAMYLKYCLEFTNEEIAQSLNISPCALRNRLFAARNKIKDHIKN